jgi:hypothetical protein
LEFGCSRTVTELPNVSDYSPAPIALDGQPTSVRIDDAGRGFHYQLVVTASTSLEKSAAAMSTERDLTSKFLRP